MLIMVKIKLKAPRFGVLFFVGTNIVLTFVTQEGPRRDTRVVACNYGRLTERDDIKNHSAFFYSDIVARKLIAYRFIAPNISTKKQINMKSQFEKYTIEELAERSADFEHLIDLLVEYTHIPKNLRNCTTEKMKLDNLSKEIHEIIRVNRKPYQNNIIQQNLFDL